MTRLRTDPILHRALALAAIVIAVLVAYANSFDGPLILDDAAAITGNPSIRQLWPWTSPPIGGPTGGRPVANFTFALNYALSGTAVGSYHAAALLIHTLCALALFGVVRRTLQAPSLRAGFGDVAVPLAAATALLWAVHPVQTTTVDYISQRTEQLMALFYLLTLYCFIRGTERSAGFWPPLAVLACALGMASKEVMATAPLIVLLYDRTFVAGTFYAAWRERWRLHLALTATWLLLGWLVLTSHLAARGAGFGLGISPVYYALTETRVVLRYLWLALWPHPLVFDYGWDFAHSLTEVWPCVAALVALVGFTLWALVRRPTLGFLGACFFVILLPTSSIVPVSEQPMAESRLYLPLAAVMVLFVISAFLCLRQRSFFLFTGLALAAAALTTQRTLAYRSELTLWADTVEKKPFNPRAHRTLGDALLAAGRTDEAIAAFQTALRLKPDYASAHFNLGNAHLTRGNRLAAIASFETVLRLDPDHAKAHNNLGNALLAETRLRDAATHYEAALRLLPDFTEARRNLATARNNLGAAQLAAGQASEAIASFRTATQLAPGYADAWHNLSRALLTAGQVPAALEAAQVSVRVGATVPETHINLGNILFQAGQVNEAAASYENALRLAPANAEAHNNLGVIFLRAGRPADAREHFLTALRLRPDYADARANLALIPSP